VDDLCNALGVLVTINVFGHLLPFLLHVGVYFLLVLNVSHSLLQFLLELLDFVSLVLVFDAFVRNLLLRFKNFLFDRLLVLFPLVTQVR
jgi:hypothetical protein